MNKSKKRPEQDRFTTVSIPTPLFKKLEERIRETEFTSVSEYVIYILREILVEEEEHEKPFTEEDKEKIKARLRALGYID